MPDYLFGLEAFLFYGLIIGAAIWEYRRTDRLLKERKARDAENDRSDET